MSKQAGLDPEPIIFKGNAKFTVMGFDKSPLIHKKNHSKVGFASRVGRIDPSPSLKSLINQ